MMALATAWLVLLIACNMPFVFRVMREKHHRWREQKNSALPSDESRVARIPPRNATVTTMREAMRNLYGRRWGRKIRILLLTGTVSEVEQLTPGLTAQLWQEDRGTLLLWGGDLNTPADSAWLTALRKLRRRPVDGLVWVTSAFDQLSAPGLEQPLPVPSESTMDSLSHAISSRMETLGWTLPLYVWSLHPRAGKPEGRITQATGCLLPAGCRTEGLAEQISALTPDLTSQGLQQICGEVKHNFLLTLADQLIREPESLTAPLSVILNPYRPLLLAGVVFSQPSAGAERAVPHHWGMDKRWDVLPDSLRMLPAALRPRKPGNDGTPFADEVTLNWIQQHVTDSGGGWQEDSAVTAATASGDNDILQLESEALTLADSDGPDVALSWLQNRPGITTARSRWLLRLLMARVAEQTGKNELALHLLGELDGCAAAITLTQWEPDLLFEVKARRLKLLRMKAGRNDTDKTRLNPEMEHLLAGLIAIDPARAAVLCA
ncbi:type VI secretion system domain-containing protein [Enterobacter hormaechei]|nr:type VI secretion system domain-containing protein [Enterobacteriaceae bacterium S32_ASV_15]MBW7726530.1 type VI secretion system domain-containing protein [Enterobacter hormaechei]HBM2675024.1 type VI secretion system domain-containing protein [Enterobacter hormaechei subsp. xiangfangensis]MDG0829515.1 type VI secretion system domain-containing protein [Enterobacter hormaechei]MDG0850554.1 type VI secretion system domain-containing protein [Enterobacter hormaechei]